MEPQIEGIRHGVVLVVGCGASLIAKPDILVYADLARWEGQLRFRRNEASNLGVENRSLAASLQYKRACLADWRLCDRWKGPLTAKWDFLLDPNNPRQPKLADGEADRVHGRQEGAHFYGCYGDYCFQPLYGFCGEQLLGAYCPDPDRDLTLRVGRLPIWENWVSENTVPKNVVVAASELARERLLCVAPQLQLFGVEVFQSW